MSRKPALKPSDGNYTELLERRLAAIESRTRGIPARDVRGGTSATSQVVQQAGHAFAVGNVIRHNGTSWVKSLATTEANAVVGGIVSAVLSPNVFVMATGGYVAGLTGLTAGAVHYLSLATAGLMTATSQDVRNVPVLIADSATSGMILSGQAMPVDDGEFLWVAGTRTVGTVLTSDFADPATPTGTEEQARVGGMVVYSSAANHLVQTTGIVRADLSSAPWFASYTPGGGRLYLAPSGMLTQTKPTSGRAIPVADSHDVGVGDRIVLLGGASTASEIGMPLGTAVDQVPVWDGTAWGPATNAPAWADVTGKPSTFPPSGTVSLTVDSTDATNAAVLTLSGAFDAQTWTMYEKRPRYNAKWLQGNEVKTGAPSADEQALLWNSVSSYWEPITLIANTGGLLTKDSGGLIETDAKLATSVFGRSAGTDGVPAAIQATADGQVLQRSSGALVWASPPTMRTAVVKTSGTTYTVPAGVTRMRAVLVGGGGSGAGHATSTTAIGTSGANVVRYAGPGGNGGVVVVEFDTVPGETLTYAVGAGGAASGAANGSDGTDSTLATPAAGTLAAKPGRGGTLGVGGLGGSSTGNIAASRNPITITYNGARGTALVEIAGVQVGNSGVIVADRVDGTDYGQGTAGVPGGPSTAGGAGVVIFYY